MSALLAYAGVSVAGAAFGVLLAAGQVGGWIALARELIFTPVPDWQPAADRRAPHA